MSRTQKTSCAGDNLRNRDFFGQPVSLQYLGRDKYNTKLGGFCSLVVFAIILALMGEIILQLTTGESYEVFNSRMYFNTKEHLGDYATFEDLRFDLAVGTYNLTDRKYVELNPQYVQIKAYQINSPHTSDTYTKLSDLYPCEFGVNFNDTNNFKESVMSKSLCVNSSEAMLLAGEDNYWKDTSVILYITKCDALTYPEICETDEERMM